MVQVVNRTKHATMLYSIVINEKNPYKKFVKNLMQAIASPVIMIEWLKQTFHVKENILTQREHRES